MDRRERKSGLDREPRFVIVGAGVAALEAMLAVRDLAGERVEVELHAPRRDFSYRPLAVGDPFGVGKVIDFDLDELARRAGAAFFRDSVVAVNPDARHVVTHDGEEVHYDHLLICPGARMLAAVPGAVTFWGVAGEGAVAKVVRGLREGELERVVFTLPGGAGWSLPAYELALLAAAELAAAGRTGTKLTVVTPEELPLGIFGLRAGQHVHELLGERGIEVIAATRPVKFEDGVLHIAPGEPIEADAVVSSPRLEGRRIAGIPADRDGFVPVDDHGRVIGMQRVYAAGDVTSFPVKQGGIATQQADAVAEAIAADLGSGLPARPLDPILRAVLWTGGRPQYMYGMLSGGHGETSVFSEKPLWEREGKIVGRYLAPFLGSMHGVPQPGSQTGQEHVLAAG
jgi:sulfide:quinone oxidoreductase